MVSRFSQNLFQNQFENSGGWDEGINPQSGRRNGCRGASEKLGFGGTPSSKSTAAAAEQPGQQSGESFGGRSSVAWPCGASRRRIRSSYAGRGRAACFVLGRQAWGHRDPSYFSGEDPGARWWRRGQASEVCECLHRRKESWTGSGGGLSRRKGRACLCGLKAGAAQQVG